MINGYKNLPPQPEFSENDVLVIFGEVFSRGYVNGIIEEAEKKNMKVIYTTVGRRENGELRPLTAEELSEKDQMPFINTPLEAGFDMDPSHQGLSPCDQLQGVKLKKWKDVKLDWDQIKESRAKGVERFKIQVQTYLSELEKMIPENANVVFVHTMAGGIPRAKIVMPLVNRIFKGYDERYMSSEEFWDSEIGKLCFQSFEEVTARTFEHLIEGSRSLREKVEARGNKVVYQAYGYHGTDIYFDNKYMWQSYAPYLQGWAKAELEKVAKKAWSENIKAQVFNAPEILTNSSSVFLGIEVALYPLLEALIFEGLDKNSSLIKDTEALLKEEYHLQDVFNECEKLFCEPCTDYLRSLDNWPAHNTPAQMKLMREASQKIINMHKDPKRLMTKTLSELVFKASGRVMLSEAYEPSSPVWWMGHDIVAKCTLDQY